MSTAGTLHLAWSDVCARRLDRHELSIPVDPSRLVDVVRAMCGAHAQVLTAAELSIGIRVSDITRSRLRASVGRRRGLHRDDIDAQGSRVGSILEA